MADKPTVEEYQKLLADLERETNLRREAEQALKEKDAKFNHVFDMFPAGIYEIDFATGKISDANEGMARYSGYTREELMNLRPWDLLTPESQEMYTQRVNDFLTGKDIPAEVQYTIRKKTGEEIVCLLNNQFLYRDGRPEGSMVIIRDITEEWNNQKILRSQAMALEQSFDGIAMFSMDGETIFINQAWAEMHGYDTAQELIGKNLSIFHSKEHYEKQIRHAIKDSAFDGASDVRIPHIKKDGTIFSTRMSTSVIKDDNGKHVALLAIAHDITESLKMEESLRQAQKMEAIGTLAGGIAHDFNNILYPIMGYAEIALEEIPHDNPAKEYLREIVQATERAKSLVAQILSFSKPNEEKQKPLPLLSVINEALKLIRATLPATIQIREDVQEGGGLIMGNSTQIHQVVMNLCTNAYYAMKEKGGILSVSAKKVKFEAGNLQSLTRLTPGQYIELRIEDTGTGMETNVASRIFEPYFTTKPQGEGTGMGLAMVHSIMAKHRGDIIVDTSYGEGTVFNLYFPLLNIIRPLYQPQADEKSVKGDESILLVDDEYSIIKMLGMALERLGYKVTSFTNSLDALDAFNKNPDAYDLALVDVTMPHMTGDELVRRMRAIKPNLPCILCTGFNQRMDEVLAREVGAFQLLKKPLSTRKLASTIRMAIDRQAE